MHLFPRQPPRPPLLSKPYTMSPHGRCIRIKGRGGGGTPPPTRNNLTWILYIQYLAPPTCPLPVLFTSLPSSRPPITHMHTYTGYTDIYTNRTRKAVDGPHHSGPNHYSPCIDVVMVAKRGGGGMCRTRRMFGILLMKRKHVMLRSDQNCRLINRHINT
jgi:hypothetical protein